MLVSISITLPWMKGLREGSADPGQGELVKGWSGQKLGVFPGLTRPWHLLNCHLGV